MPRRTVVAATLAALAPPALPAAASAAEVSYEQQDVRSRPKEGTPEHVSLDVPTGWDRQRLNRVSVGFFHVTAHPQSIVVDLDPLSDKVSAVREERRALRDLGSRYYREYDWRVNDPDKKIRIRWVFAYRGRRPADAEGRAEGDPAARRGVVRVAGLRPHVRPSARLPPARDGRDVHGPR